MQTDPHKTLTTSELWLLLLLQYAVLLLGGALLLWWTGLSIRLAWPSLHEALLAAALVAPLLLASLAMLAVSEDYGRAIELLERVLGPPLRARHIPALALLSAAVEELFFRGVLQPLLGIVPAAAVFGLMHVWNRHLFIHGLWAAGAGIYLGLEYELTGNLAAPILTHALNNVVGLSLLKRGIRTGG
jgi:membrane protease YdiL (CAAX protease family)